MNGNIGDKVRLRHMLDAVSEIQTSVQGMTFEEFSSDPMFALGCVKDLEIIGEAAAHISNHFKLLYNEIEWREIVELRNMLVHEYFRIDFKLIWDVIQLHVPILQQKLKDILSQIE